MEIRIPRAALESARFVFLEERKERIGREETR